MATEGAQKPDFEAIRQLGPAGIEHWYARELAPLLGYDTWQRFESAIKRAQIACAQIGQIVGDHFSGAAKMVKLGSGAKRQVKDFILSRFACYLIAQNGDPRKPEIAQAQAYFATSTRENELRLLYEDQQRRLALRERIGENNQNLALAAYNAGVLPRNFGMFEQAGYQGLYGGLGIEALKAHKGIEPKENILDRMGSSELAANDFRVTQTRDKLHREQVIGQGKAVQTHQHVGQTVRRAIEEIGGTMPENLPAEPSLKPLLAEKKRRRKPVAAPEQESKLT